MKIKIEKYYVCDECGRKTLTANGFPKGWMLLLVEGSDKWRVLCPDSHKVIKYGTVTTTNTASSWDYNYYPHLKDKKFGEDPPPQGEDVE